MVQIFQCLDSVANCYYDLSLIRLLISLIHAALLRYVTHFCLASYKRALANSADPDQMPLHAASDLGLQCLH